VFDRIPHWTFSDKLSVIGLIVKNYNVSISKEKRWLIMVYFDNFEPLNKYKINFKNGKKFINVLFYLQIDDYSNFMKFYYYCLIVHQRPSNFHVIYNGSNLTVFDGLSNDNEII
jgi:hypothetical protein